jgi:hypothetical protein
MTSRSGRKPGGGRKNDLPSTGEPDGAQAKPPRALEKEKLKTMNPTLLDYVRRQMMRDLNEDALPKEELERRHVRH